MMNQRFLRIGLFALLAIAALFLIGSEHQRPDQPQLSPSMALAVELRSDLPSADREAWDRASRTSPLWLVRLCSQGE